MTAAPEKCPKCYLPKNPKGSGSLTQWLSSCACDRQPVSPADTKDEAAIELCSKCGKRSREGRVGSFTQFIFRYDLCSCESPEFARRAAEFLPIAPVVFDPAEPFDDSENALEVDANEFPVDRYKPIQLTGKGASGSVYICRDRLLNKKVAVKVLHRLNKEDIMAFQKEAQVLSKLEHPNIVRLLDFGVTSGGSPYMVLEYTDGISLKYRLNEEGPLTWAEARRVFAQLAETLIYCHQRKVFHRDLKPENILFVNQGGNYYVKLIDFGIAFVKQDIPNGSTTGKALAGTPSYMAPDQAQGIEYDARSEIYSFGCVVYEALTGQPPFTADTAMEVISMHVNEFARPLSSFTDSDTTQADAFLSKCLAKKPGDRWFSMKRVLEALMKADLQARIQESSEKSLHESDQNKIIPLASALPPAVQSTGNKHGVTLLITVTLALAMGAIAVVQLSKNTSKIETKPVETYKAESKVLKDNERFTIKESRPGSYVASGTLDGEAFKKIAEMKIRKLQISPSSEVDWKLLPLLHDQRINELNLHFTNIADESIPFLTPLRFLRHLNLSETKITNDGLKLLSKMRHLRVLVLSNSSVTGDCLKYLSKHRFLTNLFIEGLHKLTPDDLQYLKGMPSLDKLSVSSNLIGDDCARVIGELNLTQLEINDCDLTDKGISYLRNAPLKNLSIAANPKLTDRSVKLLQSFPGLTTIRIAGLPKVSKEAIADFKLNRPEVTVITESQIQARGNELEKIMEDDSKDPIFPEYP